MAGSWSVEKVTKGDIDGMNILVIQAKGTGDVSDGSFPNWVVTNTHAMQSGALLGARVLFDGDATPTAIALQVLDQDGIDLLGGSLSGVNKLAASGKASLVPPECFFSTLTVAVATEAANANASDIATVMLYIIPGVKG